MRTTATRTSTRRAALGGAVAAALLVTTACGPDSEEAAPTTAEGQTEKTASSSASDSGGDTEEGAERYTGGEAISPVRFTATSPDGEQVEVQLLGMADIKAKGITDTAWLPQTQYDEAQSRLDELVNGEQLTLIEDPVSPEDKTEDGALLRYVDSTGTGAYMDSTDDVARALIRLNNGVGDNDEKWADLKRYDEYKEATLGTLENGTQMGPNELIAPIDSTNEGGIMEDDWSDYQYSS